MKMKRIIPYLLSAFFLTATVLTVGNAGYGGKIKEPDKAVRTEDEPEREMRGVWVTFMTLDVENEENKESAFRDKIDTIISDMTEGGFNTMIVHVRPFCDAIYKSAYYPWSHIISGRQGEDPGFDPLRIICDRCAEADISVHAWINPYRISTASTPAQLSEDNPYMKDGSIGVKVNGETYLDPADERTRELIVSGVIELIENYDIDGIHFDDYFYPENCGDFDKERYEAYRASTSSPLSLDEYRRDNVSSLIRDVYRAVHSTKSGAVFGVSPQGNMPNNEVLYADVERWCAEPGYIDYICPQLYFSIDNPALRYEDALAKWLSAKRHSGLKLYIGLGGYKAGTDADEGTWLDNDDILRTEVEILRSNGTDGFILYSYDSIHDEHNEAEIKNLTDYINSPSQ